MEPADDATLLLRYAQDHSDDAFAALVQRHLNLVYSVALRSVGHPHNAEEITQTVFAILAHKASQLRHNKALSSWLFQTTRLVAANFVRSEVRRQHREQEAYMRSVIGEAGHEVWPRIAPLLDTAVAALREKDRQAIVLRYYEGRNLREVGAALGTSEDAAEKRVHRALEKLRESFAKQGVVSSTAVVAGLLTANSVHAAPATLANSVAAAAVAQGAAAASSGATIFQGALKLMIWTKAKIALGVAIGIIVATGVTVEALKRDRLIQGKTEGEWIKSIVYWGDDAQKKTWQSLGPDGVQMLLRALKNQTNTHDTRMRAASMMSQLGNNAKSGIPELITLLKTENDNAVRGIELAYFEGPLDSMAEKEKTALFPELIRSVSNKDSSVRNNTLVAFQSYPDQNQVVVPLMVKSLEDVDPQVRLMAVKALTRVDPQNDRSADFVRILAGCLTTGAANDAVLMLGEFHNDSKTAVPALVQGLQNESPYVRQNAAVSLEKFGAEAATAIPVLQKALNDPDENVRRRAAHAIQKISADSPLR